MSSRKAGSLFVIALAVAAGGCGKKKGADTGAKGGTTSPAATAKLPAGLPGQSEKDLAEPVAIIDGQPLTVAEMQDRINKQSPYVRARYTSLEQKKEFLDTLVRFEVMAREAKKRGYDQDPEVVRTTKQMMIQRLLKDEFEAKLKPEDIAEDELKKYYDAHNADYNKPEEVRVSAIVVKEKAKAEKVAAEAKAPANADTKNFRDLIDKYSEDQETKERGGDLRFFTADTKLVPAEVATAAFQLKNQGDVAGPIKTDKGYYIIKQSGVRKAINKSFEDVKRQIQTRIFRDKRTEAMEAFVAELKKAANIEIKPDAIAKVQIDQTQPPPPPGMEGEMQARPGGPPVMPPPGAPVPPPADPKASPSAPR